MFECGSVAIAQPSMTKIGGITEMQKIIALADAAGVELVPQEPGLDAIQTRSFSRITGRTRLILLAE